MWLLSWHAGDRDLKAANLLVGGDGRILLADFGACATLEREARMYTFQSALQQGGDPTTHSSPSGAPMPHRRQITSGCCHQQNPSALLLDASS